MVSPKLHGIGLFDFHRAEELVLRGSEAAQREIDDLNREIDARRAVQTLPPASPAPWS